MKKKGFTLIELLAVIVILAIIALIATPIVMNVIENSKKGAAERSTENYLSAVETKIMEDRINGPLITDGVYTLEELNQKLGEVEVNGTSPIEGWVTIKNGQVVDYSIKNTNYVINYDTNKKTGKVDIGAELKTQPLCILTDDVDNSGTLTIGDKYICSLGTTDATKNLIFYVIEDGATTKLDLWDGETVIGGHKVGTTGKDSSKVALIMDSNINNEGVAIKSNDITNIGLTGWCSPSLEEVPCRDNETGESYGPLTANKYLQTSTVGWTNLTENNRVTLPTYYQYSAANGGDFVSTNLWLHDYMEGVNEKHNITGIKGYWTANHTSANTKWAFYVLPSGSITWDVVGRKTDIGIRPVITIDKSQLG